MKNGFFLLSIPAVVLSATLCMAASTTLVTYFPSPTGSYKDLKITQNLILDERGDITALNQDQVCAETTESMGAGKMALMLKDGRLATCQDGEYRTTLGFIDAAEYGAGGQSWQIYPVVETGMNAYYLNISPATPAVLNGSGFDGTDVKLFANNQEGLKINSSDGSVETAGNLTAGADLTVTGAVAATGNITTAGNMTAVEVIADTVQANVLLNSVNAVVSGSLGVGIDAVPEGAALEVDGNSYLNGVVRANGDIDVYEPGTENLKAWVDATTGVFYGQGIVLPVTSTPGCSGEDGCMWIEP